MQSFARIGGTLTYNPPVPNETKNQLKGTITYLDNSSKEDGTVNGGSEIPFGGAAEEMDLFISPQGLDFRLAKIADTVPAPEAAAPATLAATGMNRALWLKPDNFRPYYGIGLLYAKLGQREEAIDALQWFLSREPADDFAEDARQQLRQLQGPR